MYLKALSEYKPEKLFYYFEKISKIPRASYKEEKIADFLVDFAKERGLEYYRDNFHNVLIKLPATSDCADREGIVLQGHIDMVCEKNSDIDFDFDKDALDLYVDGDGFLRAKGTTLGADDGVAVALMLTILDGELSSHPYIECLFTSQEEVGLKGAALFDYSKISAKRLINLDSEDEGQVIVGCAGGLCSKISLKVESKEARGKDIIKVSISGLYGGHSGENINCGRANANRLMCRILISAEKVCDFSLVSLFGGSKDNAIPRECEAVVATSDGDKLCFELSKIADTVSGELSREDSAFCLKTEKIFGSFSDIEGKETEKILLFASSAPGGVLAMSHNIEGLVEFSRNLGVIRTQETKGSKTFEFTFSSRSAIKSQLDFSRTELDYMAKLLGASITHFGEYPGWEYAQSSRLRDKYISEYKKLLGSQPICTAIHAGIECGIIRSQIPDMDMISIGPTMKDVHSPDEALDLRSFERFWVLLSKLISEPDL